VVAVREVREGLGLLAMEYLPGGTLADRLRAPLPPPAARAVLLDVARGLSAAHARGIVHRDVKPSNVFFGAAGEAKLGDFGVAHLQDLGATQTGGFIGTLAYMSPEQITGARLSFACDLYALGVTCFQMLTGRLPFEGPDFVGQHLGQAPPAPSSVNPALGPAFDELVARLLAKDPAARPASVDELARALAAIPLDVKPPFQEMKPRFQSLESAFQEMEPQFQKMERAFREGERERYRLEAELAATGGSRLHRAVDERLGRPVIVEEIAAEALAGEAGAARLRWLRAMARHGGPRLQRVLRIEPLGREGGERAATRVVYEEALGAPLLGEAHRPLDRRALARLLRDLLGALAGPHREGIAHGRVEAAMAWGGRALLPVAGLAPPEALAPADDWIRLASLFRELGATDLPDGDSAALLAWTRAALAE